MRFTFQGLCSTWGGVNLSVFLEFDTQNCTKSLPKTHKLGTLDHVHVVCTSSAVEVPIGKPGDILGFEKVTQKQLIFDDKYACIMYICYIYIYYISTVYFCLITLKARTFRSTLMYMTVSMYIPVYI